MNRRIQRTFALMAASFACVSAFSQISAPVDTIRRGNLTIVLFEDKTWQYVDQPQQSAQPAVDTAALMSEYWNTTMVFARQPDYARTKDTTVVYLAGGSAFPRMGKLLSPFGMRSGKMHTGVDIALESGDSVVAAFDGIVRYSGWNNSGYGNTVVIRHYNGIETLYAHLLNVNCSVGQRVKAGELIGHGGASGRATCNHLHFETRLKDNAFDPELIFNVHTGLVVADNVPIYPSNFDYLKATNNSDYHYVKKGDTLYGISLKYKVSVKKICDLNGITENSILSIGQKLRLR